MTQDKERIQEMEKQLQELAKKLDEIKQGQAQEFKPGWYCIKGLSGNNWLVLNPQVKKGTVYGDLLILDFVRMEQISERGIINCDSIEYHRPATPEEVKNALTEVCKRKGIVPGATLFQSPNFINHAQLRGFYKFYPNGYNHKLPAPAEYLYDHKHDTLTLDGFFVYFQGQFADVVKEPEEKITICGEEVDIYLIAQEVSIDGVFYTKDELITIRNVLSRGQVKHLVVGCYAQEKVDLDLIKKILKRFEK